METEIKAFMEYLVEVLDAPENTIKTYKRVLSGLSSFLEPYGLDVKSIRKNHVQEYVDSLPETYSASTKNTHIYSLRVFWQFLLQYDFVEGDVTSVLDATRAEIPEATVISPNDFKKLISFTPESELDYRDIALFRLLYETGANPSDILSLKVKDVDFDEKKVRIIRSSRERLLTISEEAKKSLIDYIEQRDDVGFDEPLFISKRDRKLDRRSLFNIIKKRVSDKRMDKEITSMTFRWSYVDRMLAKGVDLER